MVGAGRGPLVTSCLQAYQQLIGEIGKNSTNSNSSSGVKLMQMQVYAVEKNPSTVLYLQSKLQQDWTGAPVRVVHSDLRKLKAVNLFGSEKVTTNLIVSELLGSFGCNELSPECLDALFHDETDVCGPNTVSIPTR